MNKAINNITPKQVLQITNILRSLGLNTSHKGTKIINKVIQYVIKYDIEFITLDTIYKHISKECGLSITSLRTDVNNALTNRNKPLSKSNFEKVFGYEYFEKNFEPKVFIEEVVILLV